MKENHEMIYAKNKITFTSETEEGTITHTLNQSEDNTWMYQLECFRKFLLAQGYMIDKRIAIIEPSFEGALSGSQNMLIKMFYEQVEESGWNGETVEANCIITN